MYMDSRVAFGRCNTYSCISVQRVSILAYSACRQLESPMRSVKEQEAKEAGHGNDQKNSSSVTNNTLGMQIQDDSYQYKGRWAGYGSGWICLKHKDNDRVEIDVSTMAMTGQLRAAHSSFTRQSFINLLG